MIPKAILVAALSALPALAAADVPVVGAAEVHAAIVGGGKAVVIDARTPAEYERAHIPGAINVPAADVSPARLPRDRATPIIFYCRGVG